MYRYNCVVSGCKEHTSGNIHLHAFPKNLTLLKMWCDNLKIDSSRLNSQSKICSSHFDATCQGRRKLKFGSVPTLNICHADDEIFLPQLESKVSTRKCCITGCPSDYISRIIYSFPLSDSQRRAWIEACNIKKTNKHLYICGENFDPTLVGATRLHKDAFPIFNLEVETETIFEVQHLARIEEESTCEPLCKNCRKYWKISQLYLRNYNDFKEETAQRNKQYESKIQALEEKLISLATQID